MTRGKLLIRILRMAQRLQVRRATLKELSEEFGVSTRTIRRDLEAMSITGLPVRNTADAYADGFNGFWWVERRKDGIVALGSDQSRGGIWNRHESNTAKFNRRAAMKTNQHDTDMNTERAKMGSLELRGNSMLPAASLSVKDEPADIIKLLELADALDHDRHEVRGIYCRDPESAALLRRVVERLRSTPATPPRPVSSA